MAVKTSRKRYRLGLVIQLVILVVIVVIVLGVTVSIMLTNSSINALKQAILTNNFEEAELAAQFVSKYMESVQENFRSFVSQPFITQALLGGTPENLQTDLSQYIETHVPVDSVSILDAQGIQVASGITGTSTIGQSFADREWFQKTLVILQPYLGKPVKSRVTGRFVIPYAIPILDNQEQLRYVIAEGISLEELSDAIVNVSYGSGSIASITDIRDGIILAHPDTTRILTPVTGKNEAVTRMMAGERGSIETRTSNGELSLIGYTPVPDFPWGVMIITPSSIALAPLESLTLQSNLVTIASVLVVGLLAGLFMLRITRPLTHLHDAVHKLAAGDMSSRVTFTQKNEIGELGNEFNRMADTIAEKELQSRNHAIQLEESNKELEAFAYSVSHDLRAPLRSIDGFSQALLEDYDDKLDASGKNYLQRVRAAAQHMGQLIDDLLNLSRITRYEMKQEKVDLSALTSEITNELQKAKPERNVTSIIASGITANGDAHLLRIALTNLLENAWKFTGKQPQARIEFGVIQKDGKSVYFVRDDGVGFDMKYADKLFTPFQRLHTTGDFPGTGIGLAIVQRIIHRHGGKIWAESEVEQGTTFYFTLG